MKELRYTLLSDGSSDAALIPILTWFLGNYQVASTIKPKWADLRQLRQPPKSFPERIKKTLKLYPCALLFIHRDAEAEPRSKRVDEIREAIEKAGKSVSVPAVCVVPVRMLEAWLLFDEAAIRTAAENPRGRQPLKLPDIAALEQLPEPKNELCKLLREASGFTGRRLKKFRAREREKIQRVAELIDDFSPLRVLPAFQALEEEIEQVIQEQGWRVE